MRDITADFEHIFQAVTSQSFLDGEGIGGEIQFYIAPYEAKKELEVRDSIHRLKRKIDTAGVVVKEINLYDIVCEILEEKGGMERMYRIEKSKSKEKFLRALQSTLNMHDVLLPKIKEMVDTSKAHVYFLTGIGLVFPFIRSHNILNNLQNVVKEAPMLAFFPGEYDGHALNLFGLFKDDNYYRAFNIHTREIKR